VVLCEACIVAKPYVVVLHHILINYFNRDFCSLHFAMIYGKHDYVTNMVHEMFFLSHNFVHSVH